MTAVIVFIAQSEINLIFKRLLFPYGMICSSQLFIGVLSDSAHPKTYVLESWKLKLPFVINKDWNLLTWPMGERNITIISRTAHWRAKHTKISGPHGDYVVKCWAWCFNILGCFDPCVCDFQKIRFSNNCYYYNHGCSLAQLFQCYGPQKGVRILKFEKRVNNKKKHIRLTYLLANWKNRKLSLPHNTCKSV